MTEESLKNKIQASMVATMRAKDQPKLAVIRLIQAAIKQQEVDERVTLDDTRILSTLDKMISQRRDSIKQFEAAARHDLAEKEIFEIGIIQEYLPPPLSQEEIQVLVQEAIQSVGAGSIRDMGKVMDLLKPKLQGRADIGAVGSLIKSQLAS